MSSDSRVMPAGFSTHHLRAHGRYLLTTARLHASTCSVGIAGRSLNALESSRRKARKMPQGKDGLKEIIASESFAVEGCAEHVVIRCRFCSDIVRRCNCWAKPLASSLQWSVWSVAPSLRWSVCGICFDMDPNLDTGITKERDNADYRRVRG